MTALLAYRGKKGCTGGTCTRIPGLTLDGEPCCYGWHCGECDQPSSMQGHFKGCPGKTTGELREEGKR